MEDLLNIVRVRRLTLAGHVIYCGYHQTDQQVWLVGTRWRREKKRTSKKDLATNIAGRFIGDASQSEWCSQSGR